GESLVETVNRTAIHLIVLAVPAVNLDDGGLVTIRIGIRGRATECLGPVSGESLDMLGMEAVAERMGDNLVGHHPTMPCVGKAAQAVVTTRCLKDGLHSVHVNNRRLFASHSTNEHDRDVAPTLRPQDHSRNCDCPTLLVIEGWDSRR